MIPNSKNNIQIQSLYAVKKMYSIFSINNKVERTGILTKFMLINTLGLDFSPLRANVFEKRILRTAFKKTFEHYLQESCTIGSSQMIVNSLPTFLLSSPLGRLRRSASVYTKNGPKKSRTFEERNDFNRDLLLLGGFGGKRSQISKTARITNSSLLASSYSKNNILIRQRQNDTFIKNKSSLLFPQTTPTPIVAPHSETWLVKTKKLVNPQTTGAAASLLGDTSLSIPDSRTSFPIPLTQRGWTPRILASDWILETLIEQFKSKNPKPIINQFISNTLALMRTMGSACPVLGLRISVVGRLGSRKKGMSQKIHRSIGKVPLTTLCQKVDYSQGFVPTRRGLIGVKIWVCYK